MRIVSKDAPSPRLLNTVAPELRKTAASEEPPPARFSLKGASLFSGNGRAIFIGIAVGAVVLSVISVVYERHQTARQQKEAEMRSRGVDSLSSQHITPTPVPIMVQIDTSQIRVSAISLGEPRLAIINGKQVLEGESITLQATPAITVNLRVVKIADGQVNLTDGNQVITVRLHVSAAKP